MRSVPPPLTWKEGNGLLFDFDKFKRITASVYSESPYSLEDILSVFHYYFEKYEEYTGKAHSPIRANQIVHIIQVMPWADGEGREIDLEPFCYPVLIDKHFQTQYRHCDYNINHFFSGRIRELRFYEEIY